MRKRELYQIILGVGGIIIGVHGIITGSPLSAVCSIMCACSACIVAGGDEDG